MHPCSLPVSQLELIKKELLVNKSRTELEEKQLRAVTYQLEDIYKSKNAKV